MKTIFDIREQDRAINQIDGAIKLVIEKMRLLPPEERISWYHEILEDIDQEIIHAYDHPVSYVDDYD